MKISINDIINDISTKEDLDDEELVKDLYNKLGEKFAYNRNFLYSNDLCEIRRMYDDSLFIFEIEDGNYEDKIKCTCKQIEEVLVEAIDKLAFKSGRRYISANMIGYSESSENHTAALLKIKDKNYYLDLYKDLYRIQKGMRTKYFAPEQEVIENLQFYNLREEIKNIKLESFSKEKLERIDSKIGYLKYGIYTDDVILKLKEEMNNDNIWKNINIQNGQNKKDIITKFKIDFILKNLKNELPNNKQMEMMELSHFYKWMFFNILTEEELKTNNLVSINLLEKNDKNETKEGMMIELRMKDSNFHYIYDSKLKSCRNIEKEEIQRLEEEGKIKYLTPVEKPEFDEETR